ncbi:MAG TPA: DUF192 domain-containing protein, partial [Usitatibacter sp.]|nr:DUF192 domain-containing protein [Usitatibacter sp.]
MLAIGIRLDRAARGLVLAALLVIACVCLAEGAGSFSSAQLKIGSHPLKVEVASTDPQRSRGLMFREKLGRNEGMLFIFDEPGYHSMWMKNTLIPLSVAFVDDKGEILNILDMAPQTLDSHAAAGPARYAIETNKGWFADKKIKAGDR